MKYLDTASQILPLAQGLLALVPDDARPRAAELAARIVNLAVRACPRGVQHTVRLNIVRAAVRGLPVRVGLESRTDDKTGRVYHALTTAQLVAGHANGRDTVEAIGDAAGD